MLQSVFSDPNVVKVNIYSCDNCQKKLSVKMESCAKTSRFSLNGKCLSQLIWPMLVE